MTFQIQNAIRIFLRRQNRLRTPLARAAAFVTAFFAAIPCAFAQPDNDATIWITTPRESHADPDSGDIQTALTTWVRLQSDLYDVVVQFDELAAQMEKYAPAFEKTVLAARVEAVRNGNNPDKIDYAKANLSPKERAQYEAVAREPTLCAKLDAALQNHIARVTPQLEAAIAALTRMTAGAGDDQKRDIARRLAVANAAMTHRKRAQEILYLCVYRLKSETGKPRTYSVERTMRQWYRIQLPILDSWLGNVD